MLQSGWLTGWVKLLSFCAGNFYFWQSVATIGFYQCLRRLADIFPSPIIETDVGPSIVQLLEEKKASLKDAKTALKDTTAKNEELHKANAGLRAKIDRLQKELEFTSNDRYELVGKTWVLQNRLGDFESWPQFREEFDLLTTQYSAMQRQRAREETSREQILHVAKEARRQLEVAKRAEAMSKIAHSKELESVKRERDEARENYETLLATTAAATTPIIATTAAGVSTLRDKALQEENTRLTLALRSKTTLLAKKTSEFERIQSLIKTRSEHSAFQLKAASATILTLDEDQKKAAKRIAALEKEVRVANEKAEEMEEMCMAVAFADEAEEKEDDTKEGDDEGDMDGEQNSWLLRRVVAMSKKHRSGGGISENMDDNEDNDEENDDNEDDNDEEEGANEKDDGIRGKDDDSEKGKAVEDMEGEKKIHDENEDLFKYMMGNP